MRKNLLLIQALVLLLAVFLTSLITNNVSQAQIIIIPNDSVTINGGDATTFSLSVTLTLTKSGILIIGNPRSVVQMQFTNNDPAASFDAWTGRLWEPWAATAQWTLLSGDQGVRTVWARYLYDDGYIGTPFSDSITYSPLIILPINPVDSVTINGGAATTNNLDVTLTLTAGIRPFASSVVSMSFWIQSPPEHAPAIYEWSAWEPWTSTRDFQLFPSGAGTKTVNVKYQLRDGTVTDSFSDSITYEGDFSVSASPASRTITAGQSTTYNVVAIPGGYAGLVTWSLYPVSGATATFNPTTVDPNIQNLATLTVATTTQMPAGNYMLFITGTGTVGGLTESTTVTLTVTSAPPPPTSPDFTISASPTSGTATQGQPASYTITVSSVGGFSAGVSLGVTGLPAGASGSFNPSTVTPTGTSTLTVTTTSQTPAATTTLTITGTAGTTTHSTTATLTVTSAPPPPTSPDFTISASPTSQTISQGQSTSYTVNLASIGGFSTSVSLTVTGLPTGATGTFNPSTVTPTGTTTLTITTTSQTPAGTSTLTVTGTAGTTTHSTTATLTVSSVAPPLAPPDFSVSASPTSGTATQGQSASYTITIASLSGFSQDVSLGVTGLPAGATASFSSSTIYSTGTSILTVATAGSTPAGIYPLTITATGAGLTHQTTTSLAVSSVAPPPTSPDFTISASPTSGTVNQGQSTTYTITVTSIGGFSTSVSLTVTGLPTGATGTFNPSTVTPTGTTTLTITTTSQTPAGTSTLTVTGTAGTTTHSTTATLTVTSAPPPPTSPDFTISASPTSQTISQGQSTSYTVNLASIGGFSTSVSLGVTGLPAGATGSFNPSAVSPTGTSTLTVTTTSQTPAATTTLTITGTAGTTTHFTTVSLVVSAPPAAPSSKMSSTVTLSVSPTEFQVGNDIVLKGSILPAREGAVVAIEYLSSGGTWNPIATVTTSIDGSYNYIWKPNEGGTYLVRASWAGDANTLSSVSESVTLHATAQTVAQTPSPSVLQTVPLWVFAVVVGGILIVTVAAVIAYTSSKGRKKTLAPT